VGLEEFEDMWTAPPGHYALVRVESEGLGLVPIDLHHKAAVLIDEDNELAEAVIRQMIEAGVPVLDYLPW
jgi:hypothetical protein